MLVLADNTGDQVVGAAINMQRAPCGRAAALLLLLVVFAAAASARHAASPQSMRRSLTGRRMLAQPDVSQTRPTIDVGNKLAPTDAQFAPTSAASPTTELRAITFNGVTIPANQQQVCIDPTSDLSLQVQHCDGAFHQIGL